MSHQTRPKPTLLLVCDLCDEEITPEQKLESGALGKEYGRPVTVPKTKSAWFIWPGAERRRRSTHEHLKNRGELTDRTYDFHGECILRLIEANLAGKALNPAPARPAEVSDR